MCLIIRGADPHLQVEGGVDKAVAEAGPETPLLSLFFFPSQEGKNTSQKVSSNKLSEYKGWCQTGGPPKGILSW